MHLSEPLDIQSSPLKLVEESFDAIWVVLAKRNGIEPLKGKALETLDWRLRGAISRLILDHEEASKKDTNFLPTMRKIPTGFVVVLSGKNFDNNLFVSACEGVKHKEVLVYCEDPESVKEMETILHRSRSKTIPSRVRICYEEPPSKKDSD